MANLVGVTFVHGTMLEFLIREYHWFTILSVHYIIIITQTIVLSIICPGVEMFSSMLVGNPLGEG